MVVFMKQKTRQEEKTNGGKEEKEREMADARRKKLLKKLEKRQMQRFFNHSGYSSTGFDMSAIYELKLRKLKVNNKALAKALADQKLETQQWYGEVITLKSELQEIQERLLRTTNDDFEAAVEYEVEKRVREHCEPISAAISTAMENVVVVVESLTKAKQVTGGVLNSCRKRSSCSSRNSSSANSFPRTSGSRLPLGPSGNNEPPRQSVLPMVSGHVLQPAMVAIPKLDVIWSRKLKERIQAREEGGLDMSAIREQSSTIEDEVSPSQRRDEADTPKEESSTPLEAEEGSDFSDSQPDISIPADYTVVKRESSTLTMQPRASSRTRNSIPETESMTPRCFEKASQKQGRPSKGARALMNRVAIESPTASMAKSPSASSVQDVEIKQDKSTPSVKQTSPESEEDPLEGPSWWYPDISRKRSSCRSRTYAKRARQSKQKTRAEYPSWQSYDQVVLESSSDSENDSLEKVSKNIRSSGKALKEASQSASAAKASPVGTLDHSYLASPTTMLARLEDLEARAGRRSKLRSKARSLRTSSDTVKGADEIHPTNLRRCTRQSHDLLRNADEIICLDNDSEPTTLRLREIDTDLHTSNDFHHKDAILMPPPSSVLPAQQVDFLITDNDLTCVHEVSMEMTEPLSNIISQAITQVTKKDQKNRTQPEKRFFKGQLPEPTEGKAVVPTKTPFDVSLMDDTVLDIPPYSSKKTIEKENLPPESDYTEDKESKRTPSLRKLSIVLQDVMKSPDTLKKFTVTPNVSLSSGSEKSGNVSGRSRRHKSLQQSIIEIPKDVNSPETSNSFTVTPNVSLSSKSEKSGNVSGRNRRHNYQQQCIIESPKEKKSIKRRNLQYSLIIAEEEDDDDDDEDLWIPYMNKKNNKKQTRSTRKLQVQKSNGSKKRFSPVDTVTEPLKRKHPKKVNESDIKTSVKPEVSSPSIQNDGYEECLHKGTQQERKKNGTRGRTLESERDRLNFVKKCFVRIHQVNLQDIKEYMDNPKESSLMKLENSPINVPAILPFKLDNQDDLSEQMQNVTEKARKMRMEQSDISGNGLELIADREQFQKQSDDKEEGIEDNKEREDDMSQCEKNSLSEQVGKDHLWVEEKDNVQGVKGHLQVEEKEDMQEEEDLQVEEKEDMQEEEDGLLAEEKGDMQEEKDDLQEEKDDLQEEKDDLQEEKDDLQEEKDDLQEKKDDLQEEKDDLQAEDKEDMQNQEQCDSLPKMAHDEAQEEPQTESIQKDYCKVIEQEGKQAETKEKDDEIQKGERPETLEEESCDITQQRVQEEKEEHIEKKSDTVDVVPSDVAQERVQDEKEEEQMKKGSETVDKAPHDVAQESDQDEKEEEQMKKGSETVDKAPCDVAQESVQDEKEEEQKKGSETVDKAPHDVAQESVQDEKEEEQIEKGSETMDVVSCDKRDEEEGHIAKNNLKVSSNDVRDSSKKEANEDCNMEIGTIKKEETEYVSKMEGDTAKVQQSRKRRAALKITSFKELSINSKLRQSDGNMVVVPSNVKRKTVRKSAFECT